MQSCCLEGCESYKYATKQKIGYFKFPINNEPLLKKWLNQIRIPNWYPTVTHQICSTHFHVDDIDFSSNVPKLKNHAVPMIFPLKHFQNLYIDNFSKKPKAKIISNLVENEKTNDPSDINIVTYSNKKLSSVVLCNTTLAVNSDSETQINTMVHAKLDSKKVPVKDVFLNNRQTYKSITNKPHIFIVSDNNGTKKRFPSPKKLNRAVLRIQIDKKINNTLSIDTVTNSLVKVNKQSQNIIKEDQNFNCKNSTEEIEVDDTTSSQLVVFKLDTSTGKITVLKKQKETKDKTAQEENTKKSIVNNSFFSNENSKENSAKIHNTTKSSKNKKISLAKEMQSLHNPEFASKKLSTEINKSNIMSRKMNNTIINKQTSITNLNLETKINEIDKMVPTFNNSSLSNSRYLNTNLPTLTNNTAGKRKSGVILLLNTSEDEEKLTKYNKKIKGEMKESNKKI